MLKYPFVGLTLVSLLNASGEIVALGDVARHELVKFVLSGAGGGGSVLVGHGLMINIEYGFDKS